MAAIELHNVCKKYDNGFIAVDQASLTIADGEFLVLVGPSGCGKSTLLRMIAGLEQISSGELRIGDRRVNDLEPGDRDIAMVFQNYALYPHMTVRQNMSFGLQMRNVARSTIADRVNEAASILSIENLLDRKPRELSGGQRQRVAVGRAIVRKPAAFLFDEPLSNLDAKLRVQMRTELAKLHQRLQTTMVYVTHDQVEAMTLGERIVVMLNGVIQQIDKPLNLYRQPGNQFVASFIGSPAMNFARGVVRDGCFCNKYIRYPLPNHVAHSGPVLLGFRPESLTTDPRHPKLLQCRVDVVERMGHETMLYFQLAEENMVARLHGDSAINPGDDIGLFLPVDQWHLFSEAEGQAALASGQSQTV